MIRKLKEKFTNLELSWILYDVGNSAFTMLSCSLVALWFHQLADDAVGLTNAAAYWSYVASIVTIIVAFVGPICGTIADNKGYKKPIFTTSLVIGVLACMITGLVKSWFAFLLVFIISKVAYASSLVFYDSMLTDVTTPERMDEVSSYGFAWGYIGSCIPFLVCLIFYVMAEMLGIISSNTAKIVGFCVTGVWWFLVTIPLLKQYKQKYFVLPQKGAIKDCFVRIKNTIVQISKKDKKVMFFLLAFFLYIDGVDTIIDNAINIGVALGLDQVGMVVVLLLIQVVAFAFSLVFSWLSKKYDTATLIKVCIVGYLIVCIYAIFLRNLWQFAIMAVGVGMFQGAIQALSRSYYGKIIPPDNSGEYFGLYDIFSKGAAFLGTFIIGIVVQFTNSINIAVGCLAVFFVLGFILLHIADNTETRSF